ncbi:hypothetical protein TWF730_010605 [Orbilia blumenaviensis]|uniref:Uncharacterized protein n=1 Tax=Orbilia blumenaviensis TaxID=1796055 RepID=A0AAV9UR99_9PEZI
MGWPSLLCLSAILSQYLNLALAAPGADHSNIHIRGSSVPKLKLRDGLLLARTSIGANSGDLPSSVPEPSVFAPALENFEVSDDIDGVLGSEEVEEVEEGEETEEDILVKRGVIYSPPRPNKNKRSEYNKTEEKAHDKRVEDGKKRNTMTKIVSITKSVGIPVSPVRRRGEYDEEYEEGDMTTVSILEKVVPTDNPVVKTKFACAPEPTVDVTARLPLFAKRLLDMNAPKIKCITSNSPFEADLASQTIMPYIEENFCTDTLSAARIDSGIAHEIRSSIEGHQKMSVSWMLSSKKPTAAECVRGMRMIWDMCASLQGNRFYVGGNVLFPTGDVYNLESVLSDVTSGSGGLRSVYNLGRYLQSQPRL